MENKIMITAEITAYIDETVSRKFRGLKKELLIKNIVLAALLFVLIPVLVSSAVTRPYSYESGQLIEATKINADFNALYSAVNELQTQVAAMNQVPVGTIVAWYNSNGTLNVPDGWQLCDGTQITDLKAPTQLRNHYTPNLNNADTYIAGTETSLTWTGSTPDPVGLNTKSLSVSVPGHRHSHTLSIVNSGAHDHYYYRAGGTGETYGVSINITDKGSGIYTESFGGVGGIHSHTITGDIGSGATSGDSNFSASGSTDNRPSTIRVKYIMKIYEQ